MLIMRNCVKSSVKPQSTNP